MTKWADLANTNPFANEAAKIDPSSNTGIDSSAAFAESFVIKATDGREIPVMVDNGTRSVYPIRKV